MELRVDKRPVARGVTHLMYVGDDEAVEKATAGPSKTDLVLAAISSYVAVTTQNRPERAFATGLAAYWWWKILKR